MPINIKTASFATSNSVKLKYHQHDFGQKIKLFGDHILAGIPCQWHYFGVDGVDSRMIEDVDGDLLVGVPSNALAHAGIAMGYIYVYDATSGTTAYTIEVEIAARPSTDDDNSEDEVGYIGQQVALVNSYVEQIEDVIETEAERVTAESDRVTAESGRVSAEDLRVIAESNRATAENSRASAETSRGTAESIRVTSEDARVSAETGRAYAEIERVSDEAGRVDAEATREENETARQGAEQLRATLDISVGTVETLEPESLVTVELVKDENSYEYMLNVGIPQGEKGDKGDKGDIGETGPIGNTGPKGDKGDPGDVQLGETSTTAYRGDRGKSAYDFSQSHNTANNAHADVRAKIDMPFVNLIKNGGMLDGINFWSTGTAVSVLSIVGGWLRAAHPDKAYVGQWGGWNLAAGTKIYLRFKGRASKAGNVTCALAHTSPNFTTITTAGQQTLAFTTAEAKYSHIFTAGNDATGGFRLNTTTFATSGDYIEIKHAVAMIIPAKYNYLTLAIIDELIDRIPDNWWDGEYDIASIVNLLVKKAADNQLTNKYAVEFTAIHSVVDINGVSRPLSLIATKVDNTGVFKKTVGYLYLCEVTQKLYYSAGKWDNPKYLCDWNMTISGGKNCEVYVATITPTGDIIFAIDPKASLTRANPIVYKNGDYNNPVVVNIDGGIFAWLLNSSIEHHPTGGYFLFGEYRVWDINDTGTLLHIWKVEYPYFNVANWSILATYYHSHYQAVGTSPDPTREIGHFHTMHYDIVSGRWIASTGDVTAQCRVFMSSDDGVTWVDQNLGGGQAVRYTNLVMLNDYVYYQTDSTLTNHALYRVPRVGGVPDFANKVKLTQLSGTGEAGYRTAYLRDINCLLFLDRPEPRNDGITDLYLYDLATNKLIKLGTYNQIAGSVDFDADGRFGFPVRIVTDIQSQHEDGIIIGTTSTYKPLLVDIMGNTASSLINALKIRVTKTNLE